PLSIRRGGSRSEIRTASRWFGGGPSGRVPAGEADLRNRLCPASRLPFSGSPQRVLAESISIGTISAARCRSSVGPGRGAFHEPFTWKNARDFGGATGAAAVRVGFFRFVGQVSTTQRFWLLIGVSRLKAATPDQVVH
ncbi:MAG: hypothetical protein ABS918_08420, partial [Saccharopolyspora rectivirgula]